MGLARLVHPLLTLLTLLWLSAASPIAESATAGTVRITPNPGGDEDPTVVLARDGRYRVV